MKSSKTSWLIKHSITVLSCVLIIVFGIAAISYADPAATSIGENIITNILTATGLTVNGNATTTGTLNAQGGITGDLTGNVVGNLTGTSTNAEQLGNISAADYSTEAERTVALANYMALAGGIISGDLTVSGTTALATTSLATTTISALGSVNGNIIYVKPGETIQSVINSVEGTADNPYTIIIPPGVWDEQITMKDYVNLQGSGRGVSYIRYTGAESIGMLIASNVRINSLTVDSSGSSADYTINRIDDVDRTNIIFSDCDIIGSNVAFYWKKKFTNIKFVDCLLSGVCSAMESLCGDADGEMEFFNCSLESSGTGVSSTLWSSGEGAEASHVKLFNCKVISNTTDFSSWGIVASDDGKIDMYASPVDVIDGDGVRAKDSSVVNIYGANVTTGAVYAVDLKQLNSAQINVYGTKYKTSYGIIGGKHDAEDETVTGTYTLNPSGVAKINSSGGAVTGTLPDGHYIGQKKHIVMTNATASSIITVTHLAAGDGGDGEVATFDAVDEAWILEWTGNEWMTIKATCTF